MKINQLLFYIVIATLTLSSCGGNDSQRNEYSEYEDSEYYEIGSNDDSYALIFNSTGDVYNYLDGKTFKGNGLSISFSNNARSVFVNGTNISNNVKIFDIGVNNNNVAYATVQVINPTGITTTFTLLAVQGQAQLIDPNDGNVYEY